MLNVNYVLVNRDCLHLEGPVCGYELWDRQVQSNILMAGFLTGSFVRMARNGKIQKEMCCVEPVAWS